MSHPLLKTLISEMIKDYLEESAADRYSRMAATGELPKARAAKPSNKPVKSFDDVHKEITSIRNVKSGPGGKYQLHHTTSSTKPMSILKNSGWTHHSGSHTPYGVGSKVEYRHPDGHTLTYSHDARHFTLKKKDE